MSLVVSRWSLVVSLFFSPSFAQLSELNINPLVNETGARPLGMGAAYVAEDDLNSILYNPAGTAWAKGIELSGKDTTNLSALQVYPFGQGSSFGLAILTNSLSNIPIAGGTADESNNVVHLSYASKLSNLPGLNRLAAMQKVSCGIGIKGLMQQTLRRTGRLDESGSGWEMDAGVLWKGAPWWRLGVSLLNALPANTLGGGKINWNNSTAEAIPSMFKAGGSMQIIGDIYSPVYNEYYGLLAAGEVDFTASQPLIHCGIEADFMDYLFLRAGLMQQKTVNGITADINLGLGYKSDSGGVDIAYYRDPVKDEKNLLISLVYYPQSWIVIKQLEVRRPVLETDDPIEKISLADNLVISEPKLTIFGKAKNEVAVLIDGHPVYVDEDHTFKTRVPLDVGKNLVVVEARWEGESKIWKYKVLRKAQVNLAQKDQLIQREIETMVTLGVVEISGKAGFNIDAGITRGELAAWIAKANGLPIPAVERPNEIVSKAEGEAIFKSLEN
ncbi:MAG: hypothetical protein QME05_06720 [Candidatus Margulisbacteria bacterium]|nr:hypothetical protein [Candidatus Margulisiibacteriota bacterium]